METATKVGRYEIVGELGRGGMGVVYRAKDPVISRIVAVKTIRLSEEGTGISKDELVERFQTEARAAGRLTHPNIVVVYDAGEDHGLYYITMELIDGKSLQSILDAGHKLTVQRTLHIMEQVCSALEFAHRQGVVHRDIKPANIMLNRDDVVKITDFGTAKIMQYGSQQKTNAIGTPGYMSPEQVKGRAIDGRSDIFSLGVMLYEMTTGQRPFRGQDIASILYKILNEEPVPPHRLEPAIPAGVSSTIMKALSKSPHMRYESCAELLDDLKNYRPGGVSPKPKAEPEPAKGGVAPAPREPKALKAEMPKIPGLEAGRAAPPANAASPGRAKTPSKAPGEAAKLQEEMAHIPGLYEGPVPGVYQGPKKHNSATFKNIAKWTLAIILLSSAATLVKKNLSFLVGGSAQTDAAQQNDSSAANDSDNSAGAPYASRANPQIATADELAEPWSSKRFSFRSLSASKYVPALVVRLPGPAASSKSYWAFALDAPFSQCRLEYVSDLRKLASTYEVYSRYPMVVNPCTRTIFDPLQMKELPGNILVRGGIVQGYDTRPPYGIEIAVSGNRILATNME